MAGRHKRKAAFVEQTDPALPEVLRRARQLRSDELRARKIAAIDAGQPTPEQLRHHVYKTVKVKEPGAAQQRLVKRNMTGVAIDRYLERGMLTDRQHRAATRYRETYERGGWERSITSRYSLVNVGSSTGPNQSGLLASTVNQLDARMAWGRARDALPQSLVSRFDRIVLHEDDASAVGAAYGKTGTTAARMAIEWVRICCDELVSYYRL
jgi:hypothetical protein